MQLWFSHVHCELGFVLTLFICTITQHGDVGAMDTVVWREV